MRNDRQARGACSQAALDIIESKRDERIKVAIMTVGLVAIMFVTSL